MFVAMGWKKLSQQAAASNEADPEPPFRPLAQPQKPSKPKPLKKRTNDPGIGVAVMLLVRPEAVKITPKIAKTRAGGPRHCEEKSPYGRTRASWRHAPGHRHGSGPCITDIKYCCCALRYLKVKRTDVGFGAVAHHKRCARGRENISKIKSARGNSVKDRDRFRGDSSYCQQGAGNSGGTNKALHGSALHSTGEPVIARSP